jgi:REP element-mobilizing transposase RayT
MARKARVNLAGYHHIINRGVNKADIFFDNNDYKMFLDIVCKACKIYKVILHDYCLMSNHYHLLIETFKDNLSQFMKQINGNYAMYFNKRHKRSGHLWQGRYYSCYVANENYLYTLLRYIEQNPIEAKIVNDIKEYPYTLGSTIANGIKPIKCALNSKLLKELEYKNIQEIIGIKLSDEELEILQKIKKQKIIKTNNGNKIAYNKSLKEHFSKVTNKTDRNKKILEALDDGYTQIEIAKFLGLSRSLISKIVKKNLK